MCCKFKKNIGCAIKCKIRKHEKKLSTKPIYSWQESQFLEILVSNEREYEGP